MIIKNTPVLGSLFLYYVKNISRPLKWTLVSLVFQVTWNAFFLNSPIYAISVSEGWITVGAFVQSLITCFTVTAIGFLLKALLMRFFAVGFHRGAYYGRIRNALLIEYVLTKLLTGERKLRGNAAMRMFADKITSVRQLVSSVRTIQSLGDLKRPRSTDGGLGGKSNVNHIADNSIFMHDGGAGEKKQSKWWHDGKQRESFMLDALPVTKGELLSRSPISNYKLAGFVEFIKRNEFSFQHGVYRDAIERWERSQLGAADTTELNQITISSLRDAEGLMEIIDLQHRHSGALPQRRLTTENINSKMSIAAAATNNNNNIHLQNLQSYPDDTTVNLAVDSLTPAQSTRMLASYIFERLHQPGSDEVTVDDFIQRMDSDIAVQAFGLFDGNWDGALSENEIYTSLLKISRDRKALKSALNDAETAIDKLDSAVTGFCLLVLFVAYFIIFGTDPNKVGALNVICVGEQII